jgi:subtilisin family serine protease
VWGILVGQSYPFLQPGTPDTVQPLPPFQPDPPDNPPNDNPPQNDPPQNPLPNNLNDILPAPNSLVVANLVQQPDTNPTVQGEVVNTTQTTQTTQTQSGTGGQRPQGNQQGTGPLRPDGRPSSVIPPGETRFIDNQVTVQINANVPAQVLERIIRRLNLTVLSSQTLGLLGTRFVHFEFGNGRSVNDVIIELEKQRIIDLATPVYEFMLAQDATSAPQGDPAQYIIDKLKLVEAHRIATGENVLVAVIDSEIDAKHPDLEGRIADRFDAVGPADKPHPHGTGMAGAIASHKKLTGTAPGARILAIRAFGAGSGGAQGTTVQIVKGLDWAISQGAKVVNMSFAGPKDPTLAKAFKVAHDKGVVLVAAAGNAGPKSPPLFPGADGNVIAVTATDVDDNVYTNANRGKYVAVAAPGVDILVPAPDGGYEFTTGTSVAAAHVSGVAALLLQRDPKLAPATVRQILISTAKQLGKTQGGRNDETGSGLIDPYQALQSLGARSAGVTAPAVATR